MITDTLKTIRAGLEAGMRCASDLQASGDYEEIEAALRALDAPAVSDGVCCADVPAAASGAGTHEPLNEMRLALVGQVHELCDQIERTLHTFGGDTEARQQAQGAIDHARKVAAPYNYNGPLAAAPAAVQVRGPLTVDELWASDRIMAVNGEHAGLSMDALVLLVRAVEQEHGIGGATGEQKP